MGERGAEEEGGVLSPEKKVCRGSERQWGVEGLSGEAGLQQKFLSLQPQNPEFSTPPPSTLPPFYLLGQSDRQCSLAPQHLGDVFLLPTSFPIRPVLLASPLTLLPTVLCPQAAPQPALCTLAQAGPSTWTVLFLKKLIN